jgi:hypothetical protein
MVAKNMLMKRNGYPNTNIFKFAWLEKNSRDYHPVFIALLQKFQLILQEICPWD